MFADYPPDRRNTRGARWNPPDVAAIYFSLDRETALAEAEFQISVQPYRPRAKRTLFTIQVTVASLVDLTVGTRLTELGVTQEVLEELDHDACQAVAPSTATESSHQIRSAAWSCSPRPS